MARRIKSRTDVSSGNACYQPTPVAARSKEWVCGRTLARIAGSNPAGGWDICIFRVLCVVRYRAVRRVDHPSRGLLPSVTCLSECDGGTSSDGVGVGVVGEMLVTSQAKLSLLLPQTYTNLGLTY